MTDIAERENISRTSKMHDGIASGEATEGVSVNDNQT